ncbi:MAG: peptidyl-prolyl cis-trans isomerase, partial [Bryobacteraceae bacterium]
KGSVTDVVNVDAQGKAAFAVVKNVTPARNAEYAEVQGEVLGKYTTAEADRLAQEAAKTAADRARKGESLAAIGKSYGLTVKTSAPFTIDGAAEGIGSATTLSAAFKDNAGDILGPVAAQSGQFVCRVSEKIPADMTQFAKNKESVVQSLTQQRQSVQQPLFRDSVVAELKRRGKIKMNQDTLNRLIGSFQS